jgi:hypothetical protein
MNRVLEQWQPRRVVDTDNGRYMVKGIDVDVKSIAKRHGRGSLVGLSA